jgi:ribosome biogenesis protein YTM1
VDVPEISPLGIMSGHSGAVSSLSFDVVGLGSEENHLYSGGYDNAVRVWDLSTLSNVNSFVCEKAVRSVSYSSNSNLIASGHSDPLIRLWDPRGVEAALIVAHLKGARNTIAQVKWSPDSAYHLAAASHDGAVRVHDMRSPEQPMHIVAPPVPLENGEKFKEIVPDSGIPAKVPIAKRFCVDWAHNLVVSGGEDRKVQVWNAESM